MSAELHVLTGNRAGVVVALSGTECTLGRHMGCTLCFGTDGARNVSAGHARLVQTPSGWTLHDLGSTNHTWLNGRRLTDAVVLHDGDRITLGTGGPVLEIRVPCRAGNQGRRTSGVRPWMRATVAAGALAGAVAAIQIPRAAVPPTSAPVRSVAAAAPLTEGAVTLEAPLHAAPPPPAPASAQPKRARRSGHPPRAKRSNTRAIPALPSDRPSAIPENGSLGRNRLAVARIWAEAADGEVSTGTAFSVRADGLLATSRHVVAREGRPSQRIAVQFTASTQVWRARLAAVSGEWDLALVRVDDVLGPVPTMRGLNLRPDTLKLGARVTLLGFPGGSPAAARAPQPVRSTAAFVAFRDRVEVYGRSAPGASGSPLLDADGKLLGVLFGGDPRGRHPVLYAVPAAAVARLVEDAS